MAQLDGNIATPEQIRLECLKLVHRHDHPAETVIARASEFERYVQGSQAAERKQSRPAKANNP
jgi:hypothetical protein